ncbi:DMT family transporter [Gynuella sp.]|uniref:DMT family transporter n=1 Tax=Gynuella sp. TaxID=2969146 RepID=UPI003D0A52EF
MHVNDKKAMTYALCAIALWSTVATAFKLALAEQSLIQLLWLADLTTVAAVAVILLLQRRLGSALRDFRRHAKMALVLGFINPLCYYLVLFSAYQRLPAQVAQPINYTWAITLSLLAIPVLGHRFSRRDLISMVAAYGGVLLISLGGRSSGQPVTMTGVALALFSTFLWAGYWLMNSKDQREPTTAIFQNFLAALPFTTLLFLLQDQAGVWTLKSTLSGIYVGLFEMGITFVLWLQAMKSTSRTSMISNLIFLSPFVSLILISQVLGEKIGSLTVVGLLVIVAALWFQNQHKAPQSEMSETPAE